MGFNCGFNLLFDTTYATPIDYLLAEGFATPSSPTLPGTLLLITEQFQHDQAVMLMTKTAYALGMNI